MPVRRVHKSVDLPDEIRNLYRMGERLVTITTDGDYLEITTVPVADVELRDGAS